VRILRSPGWMLLVVLLLQPSPAVAQWRTDRQGPGAAVGEQVTLVPVVGPMKAQPTSSLAAGGLVGALLGAGSGFALGAILTNSAAGGIVGGALGESLGLVAGCTLPTDGVIRLVRGPSIPWPSVRWRPS
jgi:hypothetical protein